MSDPAELAILAAEPRSNEAPCVTPNERTDGHGSYVERGSDGAIVCAFCKRSLDAPRLVKASATPPMTEACRPCWAQSREMALREAEDMRQDPPDIPFAGCGDSSCIATHGLGGMHTNGGCRCDERALRRAVIYWRDVAVRRQVAIQDMLLGGGEDAHGIKPDNAALTFAAEAAGVLETKHALPLLIPLLEHESPVVREGAIYGLLRHVKSPIVRAALDRLAKEDPSPGVRSAAGAYDSEDGEAPSPTGSEAPK